MVKYWRFIFNISENKSANNEAMMAEIQMMIGVPNDFKFMRKGQVGGYKDELPAEFIEKFSAFVEQQLKGSDFRYRE